MRGAVYTAAAGALTWKKGGHNIAFHAYEIATSNVEDRAAAEKEIEGLVELVNRTWEHRSEITPDNKTHQRPTVMAVYKLLPGGNCRECGQPTCWSFALKLVAAQVNVADCLPLLAESHDMQRRTLEQMIVPMPAIGQKTT